MKTLILLSDQSDYDYNEVKLVAVISVPDHFDAEADEQAFYVAIPQRSTEQHHWFRKDGKTLNARYLRVAHRLWVADLKRRFGELATLEHRFYP